MLRVRHHHALREARGARGVDDHREVDVDAGQCRSATSAHASASRQCMAPASAGAPEPPATMVSFTEGASASASAAAAVRLCWVTSAAAPRIVEDVGELLRLGRCIDGREDRAGLERREDRHDGFDAIVHEDDDAVAALHALRRKRRRQPVGGEVDVLEGRPELAGDQRRLARRAPRARSQKFLNPHRHAPPELIRPRSRSRACARR